MTLFHSSPPPQNRLLRLLPPEQLARISADLEPLVLAFRDVLIKQDGDVKALYFIETGTVSMIAGLEDGSRIEVGLAGPEGVIGLPLPLGVQTSAVEALVQCEGTALRLSAAHFRTALVNAPALLGLLLRYVDAFTAQVAQTAACNGRHHLPERLARWLLMTHDRVKRDEFLMTQELMATMLGVRRPGVTGAMGTLQRAGLIRHGGGVLTVLDRAGLEAASCGCYATVQRHFEWLDQVAGQAEGVAELGPHSVAAD